MHEQRWEQGFLMIDVLLAVVIVSVALLGVSGMFIQSTRATQSAADYTQVANLAQMQMEWLKAAQLNPKDDTYAFKKGKNIPANIPWQGDEVAVPASYTILTTPKDIATDLVEVTVTVNNVPFTTYFPKR